MATLVVPSGTVFGRYTVIEEAPKLRGRRAMLCRCECGNEKLVWLEALRSGNTKSCGCLQRRAQADDIARMMPGEVPLYGKHARGRTALVDLEDYEMVMRHRWHVWEAERPGRPNGPYARTGHTFMHTLLTGWPQVDHDDGNGLNNRRSNLRPATVQQNKANHGTRSDSVASAYKGVYRVRKGTRRRWYARICSGANETNLGYFDSEEDAARAYDAAARRLFGEYAYLNFPEAS